MPEQLEQAVLWKFHAPGQGLKLPIEYQSIFSNDL